MSDTTQARGGDRASDRTIADGGCKAPAGPMQFRKVVDRTPGTPASDVPRLGSPGDDDHPFEPIELSRDALALPVLAALAVAVATQGSAFLGVGGTEAWIGSVLVPVVAIVAVLLTLRFV